MNLSQLQFVRAVAQLNSFSKAAARCHVTQPTLSNGIAQLEDELDGRLFERTTRSVSLTDFGEHMLPMVQAILSGTEELKSAARAYREPQHRLIRLGFSPAINFSLLTEVLEPYRQANPDVEIFYKECFLDDMETRLNEGQVDVAFLPKQLRGPGQHRESLDFYQEPLFYLPRSGSSQAESWDNIGLREAAQETLVLTIDGCGLAGVTRSLFQAEQYKFNKYPGQAMSYKVLEEWANLGIGAGVLPRSKISTPQPHYRRLQLENGEDAQIAYQAIWYPEKVDKPFLLDFLHYLQEQVPPLITGRAH